MKKRMFFWLYATPPLVERITGLTPETVRAWRQRGFLPKGGPSTRGRFSPRDLAKLLVMSHLSITGTRLEDAAKTAEEAADVILWLAITKGYACILLTGQSPWMHKALRTFKKEPALVESMLGGMPKHHPKANPAAHRFLLRYNNVAFAGRGFDRVDSVDVHLGKLKPMNASFTVLDLWWFADYLVTMCGPLLEITDRDCPKGFHQYGIMDLRRVDSDDILELYSHPFAVPAALISPTFGETWDGLE
jgi:hypothetical protein